MSRRALTRLRRAVCTAILCCAAIKLAPQAGICAEPEEKYHKAPAPIPDLLNAPAVPTVSLSPTRDRLILAQGLRYPSISDLAEPMLRLAGARINPRSNGPHRAQYFVTLSLKGIADEKERKLALPGGAKVGMPVWAPDGKQFAFLRYTPATIELWVADGVTGALRKMKNLAVNAAFGDSFQWMPDSQSILCLTIPANRARPPIEPRVPTGPVIQESLGKASPLRTYTDLLENPFDEELFDYYATSQLVTVQSHTGAIVPIGKPAIFASFDPSPDGGHLLVTRIERPYSYSLPATSFPRDVEVWEATGKPEFRLASLPVADEVPIGGVQPGPRSYHWRPTAPATLVWVEALDGGNPKSKVPFRDHVLMLKAPFKGPPDELAKTEHRFSSLTWGEKGWVALLREYQSSKHWSRTFIVRPEKTDEAPVPLWDLSTQDRYHDPGVPLTRTLNTGQRAMRISGNSILLNGQGAGPEGERPFLDRLDLDTLKSERIFQSEEDKYEAVVGVVTDDANEIITRQERPDSPPNYFIRNLRAGKIKPLTKFPDPTPQLRGITKQLVTYPRADGVQCSFTLYLPADYTPGTRLPTVLWAYPREFADSDTASQLVGSTNRYTAITGISHLFFLTQGYAVLDGATMPVVGDSKTANDTFIEQIVSSARAAVDKAVEMGVTDPNRVGVGGHSYGAFMTANLLAHCDLFRAGIARSGAYNRTLTPFGFQNERRTLWEAQDVYTKLSPFMYADKIKEPLLLIHGEADNNPGTFPIQSDRLFQAIKGNGGVARLVMLPHESHGYEARESVEHVLYEMITWFDKYVKNAPEPPVITPASSHHVSP